MQKSLVELSPLSIGLGLVIGIIMTAANVYLGLYAGMTVSASIPASVMAMGIMRGVLRKRNIYEANIVQTMASAGESLAAGIIFTLPALVIIGAWKQFDFVTTTGIAIAGGLLGVMFMIPLRRALILEGSKELTYPEGIACAAVLESGSGEKSSGLKMILQGLGIGALFKFLGSGLKIFTGSAEWATKFGKAPWFFGLDISPALLAVGYIVKLEVALLVFLGGAIGWFVAIPIIGIPAGMENEAALDIAWALWSQKVRYMGVGAMVVGGLWSIVAVRKGIVSGISGLKQAYSKADGKIEVSHSQRDLSLGSMGLVLMIALVMMIFLYYQLLDNWGLTLATSLIMLVASFLFVAVSSYIVGLVGSSNNPVSGMTISALLATAAFFLALGLKGDSAILATLGVAAVVCCAACTAGDTSQDLKTGSLIGATPRSQQIAQMIGISIPAFVIAPVLSLLHSAYGIGTGLKAPQATLFASITKALFGEGELPYDLVAIGAVLGVVILIADAVLKKSQAKFRLHLMPIAVGIYLPLTLAIPMLIGGLIRSLLVGEQTQEEEANDQGVLMSSGLIAGEAIMGVVVAILIYLNLDIAVKGLSATLVEVISLLAFAAVCFYLALKARKK